MPSATSVRLTPDLAGSGPVEVVERKGIGHPDTVCDALAERFSRALCRHYLDRFGKVLHHNVDKALLIGGAARPALGGGEVLEPIEIVLAGRAVTRVGTESIPIERIAIESARSFFRETFHELDPERHVRVSCRVRPGSVELSELFARGGDAPLANDTSIGVGFAPLSALEELVLALDRELGSAEYRRREPCSGEDMKLLGVRSEDRLELTVARAMIGRHLSNADDYLAAKRRLEQQALALCTPVFARTEVLVNAADDVERGSLYVTVTGTSAEAGDDGQVGRGNRGSGLITPYRPMTLEALAGKNPVTHVGKLYNVAAAELARAIVRDLADVSSATCVLVSRIGTPIDRPAMVDVRLRAVGFRTLEQLRPRVERLVECELAELPRLYERIVRGEIALY
jgi:S-adenosylmethionine synthetase